MKKLPIFIVLILSLVWLSSCAELNQNMAGSSISPVLDRIQQRGELLVGTAASMPPMSMTTKTGDIIGLEPDLAGEIANAMGVQLKLVDIPFPDLLPALQAGRVDLVMSSMGMTSKRNLKVAFVGPYFVSGKSLLTKTKTLLSVEDPSDVNKPSTTLVALRNSTSQTFAEEVIPQAKLILTDKYDEAVSMVIQGTADALVADYPICVISVFRYPDEELASLVTPLTYEPIGVAMPANDPLLVNWMQNFLASFEDSGELEALKKDWFEDASWLKELP
jgi:polar amino acid transport system substrate-binding protein